MARVMQIDLDIKQGAVYRHTFTYIDVIAGVPTPVDLTGVTARMQIRPHARSSMLLFDSNSGSLFSIDPLTAEVVLTIPAASTSAMSFKKAVYAIELTFPTGDVERMVEGDVYLSPEIVR